MSWIPSTRSKKTAKRSEPPPERGAVRIFTRKNRQFSEQTAVEVIALFVAVEPFDHPDRIEQKQKRRRVAAAQFARPRDVGGGESLGEIGGEEREVVAGARQPEFRDEGGRDALVTHRAAFPSDLAGAHLIIVAVDERQHDRKPRVQEQIADAEQFRNRVGILPRFRAFPLGGKRTVVVLANINRNILLNDMEAFAGKMAPHSTLLLSGFYTQDIDRLEQKASTLGLTKKAQRHDGDWACVMFER